MTVLDRESWAGRIEGILKEHRASIERILALSERQSSLIDAAQGEVLLAILTERQHVIDRLMSGPEGLPELLRDLERSATWIDRELGDRVRSDIHAMAGMLEEIAQLDGRDQSSMQLVCQRLQQELTETDVAKQARAAYRPANQGPSRFADRRG